MKLIKTFSTSLQAEGKSVNTIKNYAVAVKQFLSFHKNNLNKITQESTDSFFSNFNSRNQTQNFKKNAINKFLSFLFERKHIKKPIRVKIKGITPPEPEFLSKSEQERFFEVLQTDSVRIRDFTLFATMLYTGLRISEVLNLKLKDAQEDHFIIRDSKTGAGKAYMRDKLYPLLLDYIKSRRIKLKPNDYIFQSNRQTRLSERMVQTLIKKYLKLAGIKKDLSPHSLRHTFAARLRQSGSDIEIIRRSLRHKHIQSSARYSHIDDEDLQNAIEKSVRISKNNMRSHKGVTIGKKYNKRHPRNS